MEIEDLNINGNIVKLYITKEYNSKEIIDYLFKEKNIIYNEFGKPYLEDNSLFFNISNKDNITVCVLSDKEIGIDIEKLCFKKDVIEYCCLEKEKTIIKNDYDFTLMWVKKESSIKALGCGMSIDLKTIDTLSYNGIIIDYSNYLIGIVLKEDV